MKWVCVFSIVAIALAYSEDFDYQHNECGVQYILPITVYRARPPRPTLSGTEINEVTTNFRIHYTTSGSDSTTAELAESIAVYAETCWVRVGDMGWPMPPPDQMVGGDNRYDIYIRDRANIINNAYGVCFLDSAYTSPHADGYSSWIEVTKDSVEQPFPRYARLRALIAHEFHHACQFRYSAFEDVWFYENTAVFIEDKVYDDVNTLYYRLNYYQPNPLGQPSRAITDTSGLYEYPGALWAHFLDEYYGPSIVRVMWNRFAQTAGNQTLADMDDVLGYYASDLAKAVSQYGIWRWFCGSRDDGLHFEEGSFYREDRYYSDHNTYPVSNSSLTADLFGPGGTYPVKFGNFGANRVNIHLDADNGYDFKAYVIGIPLGGVFTVYPIILESVEDSGSVSVPGWEYDTLVLMPVLTSVADSVNIEYSANLITPCATDEFSIDLPAQMLSISNPATVSAKFEYTLPNNCRKAKISIYDIAGNFVVAYPLNCNRSIFMWDGKNKEGSSVSSGVYFIKLQAAGFEDTEKLILLE